MVVAICPPRSGLLSSKRRMLLCTTRITALHFVGMTSLARYRYALPNSPSPLKICDMMYQHDELLVTFFVCFPAVEPSPCSDADGGARGRSLAFGPAAAGKTGDATRVAALARVVTKTGTPLTGMAIGVAHPCPTAGERWAKVLSAAGAQTVRSITGDLLLGSPEENNNTSPSKNARSRGGATARAAPETTGRGGDREASPSLRAAVAGLDCVLCDYPGAWSSFCSGGGSGGKSSGGATPTRRAAAAAGGNITRPAGTGNSAAPAACCCCSSSSSSSQAVLPTTAASLLSALGRVVDAGRRQGVPVVSLSWAVDCVVRGSRVKQQARPEYLLPFLEDSLTAAASAASAAAARGQGRFGVGVGARASPLSAVSGRRAPAARIPVRVFVSRTGVRYEVDDHVYYRAPGGGGDGGARRSAASPCASSVGGGGAGPGHAAAGGEGPRYSPETAVGRIVHLERGSDGRVVATLEPLQMADKQQQQQPEVAAATAMCAAPAPRGMFHVGCGGGFASPSTESSVSRGRARRARELKKVALADGTPGTRSSGRQSWHKVEADGGLLGRVSVLSAREFDARRGFCGRDPDVFAQQRVATSWANPL